MPVFEIETPQGTFEVDAPDEQTALRALQGMRQPSQPEAPEQPKPEYAPQGFSSTFSAITEGSQAGVMGGFDDEIGAGMMAPFHAAADFVRGRGFDLGGAYNRLQKQLDERKAARRANHPVASVAGEVAGGLALGGGAAKSGATLVGRSVPGLSSAAPRATQVGLAGLEGGAYGGLYGAGEAKPGERVSGAATGAAIGAGTGALMQTAGNALATRSARQTAAAAAPTSDDLANTAQQLYRASEAEGVRYKAPAVQHLGQNLKIAAGRINDKLRPKTAGFVDDIDGIFSGDMPLEVMDEFRKSLGKEAARATPDDARTLNSMKRVLDGYLDRVGPADFTGNSGRAISLLKEARKNWSRSAKTETVEKILDMADVNGAGKYTQSGFANAIRQEMRALYKAIQKGREAGWTKEEIALIRQMASGGSNSKIVNLFAKFAPRGVVSIASGQLVGSMLPGVGNVLVPMAGHVAGEAADRGALAAANALRTGAATGAAPVVPRQISRKVAPFIGAGVSASTGVPRLLEGSRVR